MHRKLNLDLYKKIYLIRRAEQAIIEHYGEDEMKTPMHMSMGEEAIVSGITMALGTKHQAFGTYRSHALYLAKTGETDKFFCEMYGKAPGVVRGIGGSMHLASPEHGLLGAAAIVASTIAPAVGAAFANKARKNGKIVAAFFGDGAMEEGVTFESLNLACLMRLPIIFVCEDNGLAVDVFADQRQGFRSIPDLVSGYRCLVLQSQSTDAEVIYRLALRALEHIRKQQTPVFMHLKYYRMLQHIGINSDFDDHAPEPKGGFEKKGYRSQEEYLRWLKKDPIKIARAKLRKLGVQVEMLQNIEHGIDRRVLQSIMKAQKAKFPDKSELYDHVYA